MKQLLVLLALLQCFAINGYAQQSEQQTLFTYNPKGKKLTSVDKNFENLFRNFPKYVENAEKVELMYYQPVGVVESKEQAMKYVEKNLSPDMPHWGVYSEMKEDNTGRYAKIGIRVEYSPFFMDEDTRNDIMKASEQCIQVNDVIWEIVFKLWDKQYHYYVFANLQDYQIRPCCTIFNMALSDEVIRTKEMQKIR